MLGVFLHLSLPYFLGTSFLTKPKARLDFSSSSLWPHSMGPLVSVWPGLAYYEGS